LQDDQHNTDFPRSFAKNAQLFTSCLYCSSLLTLTRTFRWQTRHTLFYPRPGCSFFPSLGSPLAQGGRGTSRHGACELPPSQPSLPGSSFYQTSNPAPGGPTKRSMTKLGFHCGLISLTHRDFCRRPSAKYGTALLTHECSARSRLIGNLRGDSSFTIRVARSSIRLRYCERKSGIYIHTVSSRRNRMQHTMGRNRGMGALHIFPNYKLKSTAR
jgi:hypothetical protein